jgi:hypothetical protein
VLGRASAWTCSIVATEDWQHWVDSLRHKMHQRYATATLYTILSLASAERWSSTWNSTNSTACRNLPGDESWPAPQAWARLNASVDGRLIATVPLAAPCHQGALYDADTCRSIQEGWSDPEPQYVTISLASSSAQSSFLITTKVSKTRHPSRILTGSTTLVVPSLQTGDA